MGRFIGGAVVGLIALFVASGIFNFGTMFILGADGLVDADRNPSTAWLVITIVIAFGASLLGAAIARAIGKDKIPVYIVGGIVLAISLYSIIAGGGEAPEVDSNTPENMKAFVEAIGDAAANVPRWHPIVAFLATAAGIALGGFNKNDFGKPSPQDTPPQ